MKKISLITSLLFLTPALTGCSVGMALSGKKDPNLNVVKKGTHRSEIELQLGAPKKTSVGEKGESVALYEYDIGKEPSTGRAVAHGAMDVLTLGLWEVVGTPVEAVKGDKHNLIITYDKEDKVENIQSQKL